MNQRYLFSVVDRVNYIELPGLILNKEGNNAMIKYIDSLPWQYQLIITGLIAGAFIQAAIKIMG